MSNLQWTERAGEGVTAQHKASVGKLQSRKHFNNCGRNKTFKSQTHRAWNHWEDRLKKGEYDQSVM